MKSLRVLNTSGLVHETKLTDEDGRDVQNIARLTLDLDASQGLITGTAVFVMPEIDVTLPADEIALTCGRRHVPAVIDWPSAMVGAFVGLCLVLLSSVAWADSHADAARAWRETYDCMDEAGKVMPFADPCPAGSWLHLRNDAPNPDAPEVIASYPNAPAGAKLVIGGEGIDLPADMTADMLRFDASGVIITRHGESMTIACRNANNDPAKCLMRIGRKLARLKKRCAGVDKIDPQPTPLGPATFTGTDINATTLHTADMDVIAEWCFAPGDCLPLDEFSRKLKQLLNADESRPTADVEHCWDVNCRKADPQCPEIDCSGDGTGLVMCPAVLLPPCKYVCDQFCTLGTIKKTEAK